MLLAIIAAFLLVLFCHRIMFSRKWDPRGLHCYVTGGSAGLGLALALLLAGKGAHVSIVARDEERLKEALAQLETARQNVGQIFASYSYDLRTMEASKSSFEAACKPHGGRPVDAVFAVAGSARQRFLIDSTEQEMLDGMSDAYWVQAWTAMVATKEMVKHGVKGKFCFVGSTVSYMSFIGYCNYAPAKHALRGLADTLRSELMLYDISVHMFFPCTMFTRHYEVEKMTKPQVTQRIEESDGGVTPERAAKALFDGVQKGNTHITGDLITSFFRVSTRGTAPNNNLFGDMFLGFIAWFGIPIWRYSVDSAVRAAKGEHVQYCKQKGYISA